LSPVVVSMVTATGAKLDSAAVPNNSAATGWFRYDSTDPGTCDDTFGTRLPATGGTVLGSGTSAVPFTQTVSGLLPGTRYYVCAVAQNGVGPAFSAVASFTTQAALPVVTTAAASGFSGGMATLNGTVNSSGAATTAWFRFATTNPGACDDT